MEIGESKTNYRAVEREGRVRVRECFSIGGSWEVSLTLSGTLQRSRGCPELMPELQVVLSEYPEKVRERLWLLTHVAQTRGEDRFLNEAVTGVEV